MIRVFYVRRMDQSDMDDVRSDGGDGSARLTMPVGVSQMHASKSKLINDNVHGHYEIPAYVVECMDTEHFQRLRDISQLGTASYVFLGATHKRFAHSIGTSHLAREMMAHLYRHQLGFRQIDNEREFQEYSRLVQIAALCHDLGHGPFSHLFDNEFLTRRGVADVPQLHHEARSLMILHDMIDSYNLDFDREDRAIIGNMIDNPAETLGRPRFLFEIVANKSSGLDVDKFDYLARDCQTLGLKYGFDHQRLIGCSAVIDERICYGQKEIYSIYDMFNTRFKLHKLVYNHRASKAIEYMITDILLHADAHLKISESITDPSSFMNFTDSIIRVIEMSKEASLGASRQLIRRLRNRDLYRFVDEVLVPANTADVSEVDISTSQDSNSRLQPDDLIVFNMRANFGMRQKNPVDHVHFFQNWDSKSSFQVDRAKVSYLLPTQFEEKTIRLYSKKSDPDSVDAAKRAFRRFIRSNRIGSLFPSPEISSAGALKRHRVESANGSTP
ncbi:Deoxynucleoside triphosphate triphosphohydrolase SAMHD1-like [Porphyridium purpureum]|uniref:Deoxynucleoside triphosphate triphosphohydrolase SAMHD1-like n=1 Tax=Porphyridium purpureum TaxID=35688 RepID=A0A5J4Z8C9_PORPP|nr:Deoxynucleoside triphosphate triphosphohydrolase SAMHD1-like [Porphyridium purpureum]|eukprot:POR5855..scf295_1